MFTEPPLGWSLTPVPVPPTTVPATPIIGDLWPTAGEFQNPNNQPVFEPTAEELFELHLEGDGGWGAEEGLDIDLMLNNLFPITW